jgi:glycosyltransferase involved in cell wall biosynthesis
MFEEMAMVLPLVVVAPAGEASRIVERTGSGVWVQAGDPPRLAAAVKQLMDDSDERARLSRASENAAPQFSRKRQADDMMLVLEKVAAGQGGRAAEALQPR